MKMGKVTALHMDTITEKSGHQMTGMAVSVCLTPAAPSPVPIPYPTMGTVAEGIIDPCMRTKIAGAKILTVGGCMKACHGNEPGTLKEVVSLNTGGPCFPWLGAPNVLIELGMAGITGSMGQMNKSITVGAGASASGAGGGGGGAGGGGGGAGGPDAGGPQAPSNGGGGGGGSSAGASPPSPPAPPGADGQATAGHPVDVVTGALFTHPVRDLVLPGPLWLEIQRGYSSAAVRRSSGFGWGWSHDLDWSATLAGERLELMSPGARMTPMRWPASDEVVALPFGVKVSCRGADLVIATDDDLFRTLRRADAPGVYRLVAVHDAHGNAATLEWRGDELAAVVDSVGRRAALRRDGPFLIWEVSVTDEHGRQHSQRAVTYELDAAGDLVRVIDAGGAETRFAYDEEHYLVREARPDGIVYHFRYEVAEGVKRCVETWGELEGGDVLLALGAPGSSGGARPRGIYHARLSYEPARRRTVATDAVGAVHIYEGNDLGLVERYIDPRGYVWSYGYDRLGNLVRASDGGGRTERRTFDALGRRLSLVDANGARWQEQWLDEASTLRTTMPDGRRMSLVFQGGALVEHVDAAGEVTRLAYDDAGQLISITRPNGAVLTRSYDAHGNLLRVITPTGATYAYTSDLFGRPVSITDARGVELRLHYDSRGDLVMIEGPRGERTELAIDSARRVTARRDPHGTTTYTYVGGALVETIQADGRRFRFGYDALLRLRWIENPARERYELDYDLMGNVIRETTFAGVTTEYEYDGSNYLVRLSRADGAWTRFTRDGDGRVLVAEHSSGLVERYRYGAFGLLTRAEAGGVSVTFERDADGRVTREVQEAGGHRFVVERDFDASGNLVGQRYESGWSVHRKRRPEDSAVVALRAVGREQEALAFDVDEHGANRGARRVEGEGGLAWSRDPYGLPVQIAVVGAGDVALRERRFTWTPLGPVGEIIDSRHGARRFELDAMGRPAAAHGLGASERFSLSAGGLPVPQGSAPWRVGRGGRPLSAHGAELEWDVRGRLLRRSAAHGASWQYHYDDRDRLVEASRSDGFSVRYVYDAIGRRVAEIRSTGESTWFGWDGDSLVEERRSTGESTQRVFGDDGFTLLLEAQDGGDWRMVASDAASTPWAYLHQDGSLSDVDLSTWGTVARASGSPGALRFAGQRADDATGLHYNRHRYYDPSLHVFLTPDPLGFWGSLFDVAFVPNVTLYIDPSGLTTIIIGAPQDKVIMNNTNNRILPQHPGAKVIHYNDLKPDSLKGESHVIVQTHGAPGLVQWGNGLINGKDLSKHLKKAGFKGKGAKVDVFACNSATPVKGGGTSVAQAVANKTGATASGPVSNDPEATYKNQEVNGGTPGIFVPHWDLDGSHYVHEGSWKTVQPRKWWQLGK